jgi:hypothetical protein
MKLKNYIVLIIGLIISIIGLSGWFSGEGLTNGIITMFIGYPLILIGLVIVIYKAIKNRKSDVVH